MNKDQVTVKREGTGDIQVELCPLLQVFLRHFFRALHPLFHRKKGRWRRRWGWGRKGLSHRWDPPLEKVKLNIYLCENAGGVPLIGC